MESSNSETKTAGRPAVRLVCLLLALITLVLYWPVRNFEFNNYDDAQYLTGNPSVQNGLTLPAIKWAFTTGYGGNWHPLTWLSHLLDIQLFGWNAGAHHFVSVLFHIANTLLLFLLLRRWTGALWRPAFVAALFAWHPLRAESVAWVAERKDVLSALFWMLTLLAYTRYAKESPSSHPSPPLGEKDGMRGWYYALALIFFALGLMSKPMLVSLPLILLVVDYWPLQRIAECGVLVADLKSEDTSAFPQVRLMRAVLEKIPFLLLALGSCVITFLVQQKATAVNTLDNVSIGDRISNALVSYVRYLGKLFWPMDLAVPYPYTRGLPMGEVLAAAALLLVISLAAVRLARSHPPLIVGWLWFVITLVPVIGLVQVGEQALADRYTYIPSIGLFIIAWEVPRLFRVSGEGGTKAALATFAAIVLVACALDAAHQIQYWRNSVTLFTRAVEVTKDNATAECNLGAALGEKGNVNEAIAHEFAAVRLRRDYAEAESNLGQLLGEQGKTDEAISHLQAAIKFKPEMDRAHFALGLIYARAHRVNDARAEYRTATTINPGKDQAHANLGIIYAQQGHLDDAIAEYRAALATAPKNAFAQNGLGAALEAQNKLDEAAEHYAEAVASKPDFVEARDNLGMALMAQGHYAPAEEQFAAALKLRPGSAALLCHVGNARLYQANFQGAADEYADALRLQPNDVEANFNLGLALTKLGRSADAIESYRTVLRVQPDMEPATQKLAWLLATSANEKLRSGAEALALHATQLAPNDAAAWDTLAAAQAEAGRYGDAVISATKALELAGNKKNLAKDIQARLELYQLGKPYHAPAVK